MIRPSRSRPPRWTHPSDSVWASFSGPSTPASSASVKPRIAFIGVRSSWLTLARNRDLASLARASEALVLREPLRQHPLALEGVLEPLARAVQVLRQLPELVAVRHLHPLPEVAALISASARCIFLTGSRKAQDSRKPDQQGDEDAHRREGEDDGEEQVVVGIEVFTGVAHLLLGQRDEGDSSGAAWTLVARWSQLTSMSSRSWDALCSRFRCSCSAGPVDVWLNASATRIARGGVPIVRRIQRVVERVVLRIQAVQLAQVPCEFVLWFRTSWFQRAASTGLPASASRSAMAR